MNRFRWRTCLVKLDDIIIFSNNLDAHRGHVRDDVTVLRDAEITRTLKKCKLLIDTV